MKGKRNIKIPEFESLDEEREYWEARGPLAEGYEGRAHKPQPGQKRSSFLSVRLTGSELTELRDMAARFGLGPSTYARYILALAIEQKNWPTFLPPSFMLAPLYDSTRKHAMKPLCEVLGRVEKAYSAYLEAEKEAFEKALQVYGVQTEQLSVGEK